jgi:hypothetical protein
VAEHPGHAVERILIAYQQSEPPDGYHNEDPQSPWAQMRHPAMAERAILELATAPTAILDRAGLAIVDEVFARHTEYNAYDHDDLATAPLAGYAVGLDAVMRARGHRPSDEYLSGRTSLLLSIGQPAEEAADRLATASEDHLRGIADSLACRVDPATGQSPAGMLIDGSGGDAGRLADLINAEITSRREKGATGLATIAVQGRHTPHDAAPRVGDAVRVRTPEPRPIPAHAQAYAGFVIAGFAPPRSRLDHRLGPRPDLVTGTVTATHAPDGPSPRVTVNVAGYGEVTVPVDAAQAAPGFPPVQLSDDHGQVSDPLHAERLLGTFYGWFTIDLEGRPGSENRVDHDLIAEALAAYSSQSVPDLLWRIQKQVDPTPLARFYDRHPDLQNAAPLFPRPVRPPTAATAAALEHPAAAIPPPGRAPVAASSQQSSPSGPQRRAAP